MHESSLRYNICDVCRIQCSVLTHAVVSICLLDDGKMYGLELEQRSKSFARGGETVQVSE